MFDLSEIKQDHEIASQPAWWGDPDRRKATARLLEQIPALVAKLTQVREELAAVDESLGDFYAPVLDPETEEPCGSFWKDHGVNVMRQELEQARAEIERLRAPVPSVDLLRCLADYTDSATEEQHRYQPDLAASGIVAAREARALAQRIKEIQA